MGQPERSLSDLGRRVAELQDAEPEVRRAHVLVYKGKAVNVQEVAKAFKPLDLTLSVCTSVVHLAGARRHQLTRRIGPQLLRLAGRPARTRARPLLAEKPPLTPVRALDEARAIAQHLHFASFH